MQLEYAFLCNFANFLPDGRLVVVGADIDRVERKLPSPSAPQVALVAKFLVLSEEPLDGHTICVQITSPSGDREVVCDQEPLRTIQNREDSSKPVAAQVAVNLGMEFDDPGTYLFHLSADGREVKTIALDVSTIDTSQGASGERQPSLSEVEEDAEWAKLEKELLTSAELIEIHEYLNSTGQASA